MDHMCVRMCAFVSLCHCSEAHLHLVSPDIALWPLEGQSLNTNNMVQGHKKE